MTFFLPPIRLTVVLFSVLTFKMQLFHSHFSCIKTCSQYLRFIYTEQYHLSLLRYIHKKNLTKYINNFSSLLFATCMWIGSVLTLFFLFFSRIKKTKKKNDKTTLDYEENYRNASEIPEKQNIPKTTLEKFESFQFVQLKY